MALLLMFLQEFVDSFSRALVYEYSSQGVEVQVCSRHSINLSG